MLYLKKREKNLGSFKNETLLVVAVAADRCIVWKIDKFFFHS
jgi:hypothetical protein